MAKRKSKPIEPDIIEELIGEPIETEETIEVVEESSEQIIDEPVEDAKEEVISDNSDQFFFTQLRMINKLNNPAKAKRLSDRVLRNRKR